MSRSVNLLLNFIDVKIFLFSVDFENITLNDDEEMETIRKEIHKRKIRKEIWIPTNSFLNEIRQILANRKSPYKQSLFEKAINKRDEIEKLYKLQEQGTSEISYGSEQFADSLEIYLLRAKMSKEEKSKIITTIDKLKNKIRQFPWILFDVINAELLRKSLGLHPIDKESFTHFLQNNRNRRTPNALFSSLKGNDKNMDHFGFALLQKGSLETASDETLRNRIDIVMTFNFIFANYLFFNHAPNSKQHHIGKKYEIVCIYLTYLENYCRMDKDENFKELIEDVNYTLEILAKNSRNLLKLPQYSIFYSINLYKRILTESTIIESITKPAVGSIIRKAMNLESKIHSENIIKFIGCMQWMNDGKCPKEFEEKGILSPEIFKDIIGFDNPSEKVDIRIIFRILLKEFIEIRSFTNGDFIFVNKLKPERNFYFNDIPANFMRFLIYSLNPTGIKLRSHDFEFVDSFTQNLGGKPQLKHIKKQKERMKSNIEKPREMVNKKNKVKKPKNKEKPRKVIRAKCANKYHKNLDLNLFAAFKNDKKYDIEFADFLFKKPLSDKKNIQVCWKTLRPKSHFQNNKMWSDQCNELNKGVEHHERIRQCDSLHTSLYKQYLTAFYKAERFLPTTEFIKYLIKRFPFKTFQETIVDDVEDVVMAYAAIFAYYVNEPEKLKKIILDTKDFKQLIDLEIKCEKNPIQGCFHAEKTSNVLSKFLQSLKF